MYHLHNANKGVNYKPREGEGYSLSVNSKPSMLALGKFFFSSGNGIDLPCIHRGQCTSCESRGYRLKYDCFTSHSQGDLNINLMPERCIVLCLPQFFLLYVVSLKAKNHMTEYKSGLTVEGMKLYRLTLKIIPQFTNNPPAIRTGLPSVGS